MLRYNIKMLSVNGRCQYGFNAVQSIIVDMFDGYRDSGYERAGGRAR